MDKDKAAEPAHVRVETIFPEEPPPQNDDFRKDTPPPQADVKPATDAPVGGETVKLTEARLPATLPFISGATGLKQSPTRMSVPGTQWRSGKKTMPNDKCPCGSGKKHKKCCGGRL